MIFFGVIIYSLPLLLMYNFSKENGGRNRPVLNQIDELVSDGAMIRNDIPWILSENLFLNTVWFSCVLNNKPTSGCHSTSPCHKQRNSKINKQINK